MTLASGRNLPVLLCIVVFCSHFLYCRFTAKKWLGTTRDISFILAVITLFSPLDICCRRSDRAGVYILPVVYDLGARQHIRDLQATGNRENVHFIVIRRQPLLNGVMWSVTILLPARAENRQEGRQPKNPDPAHPLSQVDVDSDADGIIDETSAYEYNDNGIRVKKTEDGEATLYLVDGNNPTGYAQVLEEMDAFQQLLRSYTLGHDIISQAAAAGTVHHLMYDAHGSTRALLDAAGAIVTGQVFNYDAYGNAVGFDAATALTTILYCGEQFDIATDQLYLRTRYYDAAMGRYNRSDDFTGDPGAPQSLHKYLYTHGDPVNGIDPTGLWSLGSAMTSIGMQAGLTALHNYVVTNIAIVNIARAEAKGVPSGVMVNVGASAATTGVVGSGSVSLYFDFATKTPHLFWTAEAGSAPVARFSTQRGFGWNFTFGLVWNAAKPNDVTGYSVIATTPSALLHHSTTVTDIGSWHSAMMLLARYNTGNIVSRGGSFQAVQSLSGPTVGLFFGHRDYSFSATLGYTRRLADLSGLGLSLRQKLESITEVMSVLSNDPAQVPHLFSQIDVILGQDDSV